MEIMEIKEGVKKYKQESIPGIYERHMSDISEYLQAKFPQIGKDELMEAAGYISNRTFAVIADILAERDREWNNEIDRMRAAYEREMVRRLKVSRRDINKDEKEK